MKIFLERAELHLLNRQSHGSDSVHEHAETSVFIFGVDNHCK